MTNIPVAVDRVIQQPNVITKVQRGVHHGTVKIGVYVAI
jgi:hypothetical protein